MSEIDIPVVEDSYSLRGAPEQEAASSKPTILLMVDTEPELVVVSPEVELVDYVQIRVGPEKCTNNARGFEGKEREDKARTVGEEVFVDDQIGSCGLGLWGREGLLFPSISYIWS